MGAATGAAGQHHRACGSGVASLDARVWIGSMQQTRREHNNQRDVSTGSKSLLFSRFCLCKADARYDHLPLGREQRERRVGRSRVPSCCARTFWQSAKPAKRSQGPTWTGMIPPFSLASFHFSAHLSLSHVERVLYLCIHVAHTATPAMSPVVLVYLMSV